MKAGSAAQRQLLDLADLDAELARIAHRARTLPEDAELAELGKQREAAHDDVVRSEITAEDLTREYKRIDSEVNGMSAREAKDTALLQSGKLAPKALTELQHELAGLGRRRAVLEDELLSVMEQQEAVGTESERAQATVLDIDSKIGEATGRRDAALAKLDGDREVRAKRRDEVAAGVDEGLLAVYDRQRSQGRAGAALLRARRCGGCGMELDRGLIAQITAAAEDEVVRCDECGAVLVRTAESGL